MDPIDRWLGPGIAAALAVFGVLAILAAVHLRARGLLDLYLRVRDLSLRHASLKSEPLHALKAHRYAKLEARLRDVLKKEGLPTAPPTPKR